jgi:hypothetical protein
MELSKRLRFIWWLVCFVGLVVILFQRKASLLAEKLAPFDEFLLGLVVVWAMLPRVTEMEFFGIKLKSEVRELRQEVQGLRLAIAQVQVQQVQQQQHNIYVGYSPESGAPGRTLPTPDDKKAAIKPAVPPVAAAEDGVPSGSTLEPLTLTRLTKYARDLEIDLGRHARVIYANLRNLGINTMAQFREAVQDADAREILAKIYKTHLEREPDGVGVIAYQPIIFLEGERGRLLVEQQIVMSSEYRDRHAGA